MKKLLAIAVLAFAIGHLHGQALQPITGSCTVPTASGFTCNFTATTPPVPPSYTGPCDVLAAAGTPCVAAYSFTRRMLAGYANNLFQLTRASDGAKQDIGTVSSGYVNVPVMNSFCANTTCTWTEIYDQMHTPAAGNNLIPACCGHNWPTGAIPTAVGWTTLNGVTLPIARILNGSAYYDFASTLNSMGVPVGNSSITVYEVVENTSEGGQVSGCCGSFGDTEIPIEDAGKGAMFSLAYSTGNMGTFGTGPGPWPGIDLEQGVFLSGPTPTQKYLTILGKYNAANGTMELKLGDATQGTLQTLYNGALPAGYTTLNLKGAVSLGMGGDGSNSPINFIEGAIVAAPSAEPTDTLLQNNITGFY